MAGETPTRIFPDQDNMSWWSEDKFEVLLFLFERCSFIFTPDFIATARREVLFCPEKVTDVEVVNVHLVSFCKCSLCA